MLIEEILSKLVSTNCLPMLLYGIDTVSLMKGHMRMSVAYLIWCSERFLKCRSIYLQKFFKLY